MLSILAQDEARLHRSRFLSSDRGLRRLERLGAFFATVAEGPLTTQRPCRRMGSGGALSKDGPPDILLPSGWHECRLFGWSGAPLLAVLPAPAPDKDPEGYHS